MFNHSITNTVGSQHCWSILAVGRTCVTCEPSMWPSFPWVSQWMGHRFQSWPSQWHQWLDARPRPVELIKPNWEQVSWASLLSFWTVRGRKWGPTCINCVKPLKVLNSWQHWSLVESTWFCFSSARICLLINRWSNWASCTKSAAIRPGFETVQRSYSIHVAIIFLAYAKIERSASREIKEALTNLKKLVLGGGWGLPG